MLPLTQRRICSMTRFFRLMVAAAALSAPLLLSPPPAAASSPAAPFEEVAQARDGSQARTPRRTRREGAQAQRRQRQPGQRTATRRPRAPTQG